MATLRKVLVTILLPVAGSAHAQSLVCSVTPQWKVSSVTQTSSGGELSLAIETTDARETVQRITLSIPVGSTRYVTSQGAGRAGWTFLVHVQEDERPRTVRVSTQASCDGRVRGYDEAVLPIQVMLDRT